jgi:tryptophan synthase alpha chain
VSRISGCFQQLRTQGRKALIPYLTAGDPHPRLTVALMQALVTAGADIIELGVPFSDPMADGPVIQRAHERALAHGTSLHTVLAQVAEFRQQDNRTPVVLMGYLNPIETWGYAEFAQAAAASGVDGCLIVDLPPEEAHPLVDVLRSHALDLIFLIAPTTTEARAKRIIAQGSGFLYYVSLKGVTGAGHLDSASIRDRLAQLRPLTSLPLGVGFGIRDGATARAVAEWADAVVVGSALIQQIESFAADPEKLLLEVQRWLAELRTALDGGQSE